MTERGLDELPGAAGSGHRLFGEADKDATKLELVEHEAYSNGIQAQVFEVVGSGCTLSPEFTTGPCP